MLFGTVGSVFITNF